MPSFIAQSFGPIFCGGRYIAALPNLRNRTAAVPAALTLVRAAETPAFLVVAREICHRGIDAALAVRHPGEVERHLHRGERAEQHRLLPIPPIAHAEPPSPAAGAPAAP